MMAPPITNAREGSHRPAMSRKPSTFSGLAMPETIRPIPKTRPANSEANEYFMASGSDQVANNKDSNETGGHKAESGNQRAQRQAGQPAYAMAAGAAGRVAGADAHRSEERRVGEGGGL